MFGSRLGRLRTALPKHRWLYPLAPVCIYYAYIYLVDNQIEYQFYPSTDNQRRAEAIRQAVSEKYAPSPQLPLRCMEIIYGNTLDRRHQIEYDRQILRTVDGENLAVDWAHPSPQHNQSKAPVVLLLAGLSGNSTSTYICKCARALQKAGFRTAVYNTRGCILPQRTQNLYDFKVGSDLPSDARITPCASADCWRRFDHRQGSS